MNTLSLAAGLAMLTAVAHSYLSERYFLRPLRAEGAQSGVFGGEVAKRLSTAMFHLPSLFWAGIGVSMLALEPASPAHRFTLQIYAALYALSGVGNFWAVGKPHPGGVILLSTSALILVAL